MGRPRVAVVRTGTANTASVISGLSMAGAEARLVDAPEEAIRAGRLVLPGVGAFAAAVGMLVTKGLVDALVERVDEGRPTLGICLGLQILCKGSEESPGTRGLAVLPHEIKRFSERVRVPQLGWNRVDPDTMGGFVEPGYAYFANSYCLRDKPDGWEVATTDYDGTFVSAIERGPVLACQFHPELSGRWGIELIRRWISA